MGGTHGREAMERFTLLYMRPVRAYLEAIFRRTALEAEEHASEFFATKIWDGRILRDAKPGHARFRHYLKRCVHNYAISVLRRTRSTVTLETARLDARPSSVNVAWEVEQAFHIEWVRGLLSRALERTRARCDAGGQQMHFELFRRRFLGGDDPYPSWEAVGAKVPAGDGGVLDLTEREAQRYADTAVRHFRRAILEELEEETGSKEAAEEELSTLFAVFEGPG
jgi:DNA-directed RNA polymerase specialized sigma24 family protein